MSFVPSVFPFVCVCGSISCRLDVFEIPEVFIVFSFRKSSSTGTKALMSGLCLNEKVTFLQRRPDFSVRLVVLHRGGRTGIIHVRKEPRQSSQQRKQGDAWVSQIETQKSKVGPCCIKTNVRVTL